MACIFATMKKRLLVGLISMVYMVFCCAGLGFAFAENQQESAHFVHVDGHSDEYHGSIPGKLAIKAFFAKIPVKSRPSSDFINPGTTFLLVPGHKLNFSKTLINYVFPVKGSRYLQHCTFLI